MSKNDVKKLAALFKEKVEESNSSAKKVKRKAYVLSKEELEWINTEFTNIVEFENFIDEFYNEFKNLSENK
jgi:hypothetical protein